MVSRIMLATSLSPDINIYKVPGKNHPPELHILLSYLSYVIHP